ncbi:hypothetical protein Adt_45295 [Abeliophyllum distichum]|uniref:Uncharacterized protein n=1 Tax=Abeliophyllum distichum TaxID=126358 RepID=A0ABD1PDD0_9LAMI
MRKASSSLSSSPSVGGQEYIDQRPTAVRPPPTSTSEISGNLVFLPKEKAGKGKGDARVPEMRGLLGQRDAPAAQRLDQELKFSATEASMVRSKIRKKDLEDIRLSYDILASVTLQAPGPEE